MAQERDAHSAWSARYAEATRYLDEIRERLVEEAQGVTPTSVNWTDVGEMGRVLVQLRELVAVLRGCDPAEVQ